MGLGTRRVFLFFFFFWIWLLITSSWDSISLPLPCFSCFLSSRVFLGPSVGGRLVLLSLHLMTLQLSGVLSLLSQVEVLGLQQILCHFSGQMPSSLVSALCCFIWELSCDFRPLFSAFILSSLTWRSLLMELCFSRSVSFSQCLTELWFHVLDLLLWRVDTGNICPSPSALSHGSAYDTFFLTHIFTVLQLTPCVFVVCKWRSTFLEFSSMFSRCVLCWTLVLFLLRLLWLL